MFEGFRVAETQLEYWNRGRTIPGPMCKHKGISFPIGTCLIHPLGLTVTNAKPGDSIHEYGLAADYVLDSVLDKPGIQWSWDLKLDLNGDGRSDWQQMAEIAKDCGLESGFFWLKFSDAPHVQNTFGMRLTDIKELYRIGGIKRVWQECY
jgi:hypothetical protein